MPLSYLFTKKRKWIATNKRRILPHFQYSLQWELRDRSSLFTISFTFHCLTLHEGIDHFIKMTPIRFVSARKDYVRSHAFALSLSPFSIYSVPCFAYRPQLIDMNNNFNFHILLSTLGAQFWNLYDVLLHFGNLLFSGKTTKKLIDKFLSGIKFWMFFSNPNLSRMWTIGTRHIR